MAEYDYDLFTIGAGSGGVRASRMSAVYGAKVAVAEERKLGGTCVNVGCIPKKLLVYASHFNEEFEDAAGFGWSVGERRFDWTKLIANKDKEIDRLNGVYKRVLENAGAEIIYGTARIIDPHTVTVGDKKCSARYILVATGGRPDIPKFPGFEHAITSNEAFYLPALPRSIVIVGGGYIGVEFAGIFHGMGTRVTLVHRRALLLSGFDDDVREALGREMQKKGIDLRMQTTIQRIDKTKDGLRITLANGDILEAERIMFATGRSPNTAGLGLEQAGVKLNERGAIIVDRQSRSTTPSIYATSRRSPSLKDGRLRKRSSTTTRCN